ncbi:diguanylate cyclase [Dokdonella sp.]|uniref:sensor domain-containing diguanylate cyclase n=1 Tax=Dokdonella sp. TaxID=2291710 RepID=UPI00352736A7
MSDSNTASLDVSVPATLRHGLGLRVNALFLLMALILCAVAVQVYRVVGDFVAANHWVVHSMDVRQEITQTLASLHTAEASQRAYLISGSVERLADYAVSAPRVAEHIRHLQKLVADDAEQNENISRMAQLMEARVEAMRVVLETYEEGGLSAARATPQMLRSRSDDQEIDGLGQRMLQLEQELLLQRQANTAGQAGLARTLTIGAILFCVLILGLAMLLVRREQRQRLASMDEASSANADLRKSLLDAQHLSQTLRQLSELGEMLQGCRSVDEAARGLSISLPLLLPQTSGSINLINASQNLVEPVSQWGGLASEDESRFAPDDCWALRRGHAYPLAGTLPAFTCKHLEHAVVAHPEHGHLCIPMMAHGEMLGVVTLNTPHRISDVDRRNASAASEQISMALSNLKLQETLRTQSLRDPLTGLFNRRYLEASLEREVQRAERRGAPLSVLMLDIDHFKAFNDTHGHDAGDALLSQFGTLLGQVVRSEDISCRYGGEEFTVLMPEAGADQARQRAEEICAAVRNLDVRHRNLALGQVTVSIGVATFGEHGKKAEELMRNADNALYLAKSSGRDRCVLAEVLHPRSEQKATPSLASVSTLGAGRAR